MPSYAYRATTDAGRTLRGVEQAASEAELERLLAARGLAPLEIQASAAPASGGRFRGRRTDVVLAMRSLATLVGAGFPLERALGAAARVATRRDVAAALAAVRTDVREGSGLAVALARHPGCFPRLAVGMARAGERGGELGATLDQLADQLERDERLRADLAAALAYPALLIAVGGAAVVMLVGFVLPRFVDLFADLGVALPASTRALLAVGAGAARWWPLLLGAALLAPTAFLAYRGTASGRLATDRFLLRLPAIGAARRRLASARLGRALGALLGNGLPILPSLDIAAEALVDSAAAAAVIRARAAVGAGGGLAPALQSSGAFTFVFLQMVALGEEAGRLPEMLLRAADAAEDELRRGLQAAVRLLEPAVVVLIGVGAGFVALALLQAIYGLRVDLPR